MSTRGTSANGIPNESTTWLITSALVGFKPTPSTIRAGARVIARRRKIGIRRRMNPCMTTWPAIVPTEDEANPEASRAIPKTVAAFCEIRWWSPS